MALAPAEDGASCSQVRGPDEQAVKTAEQEEEEAEEDEHDDDGVQLQSTPKKLMIAAVKA
eukprot:4608972-Amphidinium_carterae.1